MLLRLEKGTVSMVAALLHRWLGSAILKFDTIQQRRLGVRPYTDAADCIFRIAIVRAEEERELSDGTQIRRGDRIVELHHWNEQVPRMRAGGAQIEFGARFHRSLVRSLRYLARHLNDDSALADVSVIVAEVGMSGGLGWGSHPELLKKLGFDFVPKPPARRWQRIARTFVNVYTSLLAWSVNPHSVDLRSFSSSGRAQVWMSRDTLFSRYGNPRRRSRPGEHVGRFSGEDAGKPVSSEGAGEPALAQELQNYAMPR